MQEPSTDNILKLKNFFEDQGFLVEETQSGIRIQLNSEYAVDVNALVRDSDFFWASFKTAKISPEQLGTLINDIRKTLSNGLLGMARLGEFEATQDEDDRFVFIGKYPKGITSGRGIPSTTRFPGPEIIFLPG